MKCATHPSNKRNHIVMPSFGNIISEIMNTPLQDIVNEDTKRYTSPAANVSEHEDYFLLSLAIPGVKKEEVSIELDRHQLVISADLQNEDEQVKFRLKEFNYNKFSRRFRLPRAVDRNDISASFENGILSIKLNKKEEQKARQINII